MLVPALCFAIVFAVRAGNRAATRHGSARRRRMSTALATRELGSHRPRSQRARLRRRRHRQPVSRAAPTKTRSPRCANRFAAGVRYFDTAPFYGFGLSELRARRSAARRAAAAGDLHQGRPPARAHGSAGCAASAARAISRRGRSRRCSTTATTRSCVRTPRASSGSALPRVDILLCHDIGRLTHGDAHDARVREFLDGGYRAMRELRDSGAVRAIGLGVNEWEVCVELLRAVASSTASCSPAATRCSSSRRSKNCCRCASSAACPSSAAGRSTPESSPPARAPARNAHYNYAAPPAAVLERVRQLEALCAEFDVPLQAAALQFPLASPGRRQRGRRLRRMAPKRAIARRCSRIPFRLPSGARCAIAGWSTRARRCPRDR